VLVGTVHAVIENFRIDGTSMQPTFASGEALIVNRTAYLLSGGPQRGDVVVFRAPPEPNTDYIKRVIGLPGESILVQRGRVFVNGQALDEPYVHFAANYQFPGNGEPVTIPQGTYFVLGDNRPDSFDSHTGWVVPTQNLIGRAWLRYWPPAAWGVVTSGSWSLETSESASSPNR
jgi:signal peptidase I